MKKLFSLLAVLVLAGSALAEGVVFTGHGVTAAGISGPPHDAAVIVLHDDLIIYGKGCPLNGTWEHHETLNDVWYTSLDGPWIVFYANGQGLLVIPAPENLPGAMPLFIPFTWHL